MHCTFLRGRSGTVHLAAAVAFFCWPALLPAQSDRVENSSVIPLRRAAAPAGSRPEATELKAGDSSRRQRQAAIQELPISQLTPEGQQHVQRILKNISIFRRLPTFEIEADQRAYEFFTAHPDVAVSIWRALKISSVQMWQTGPTDYELDTLDGTQGTVEVLLATRTNYLVLCRGQLQSPALPKPIYADAVMHLQPRFTGNGKVVHVCDMFVSLPSQTIETIAKLISPVSNHIADRNFEEVSLFMQMMSSAMGSQPGWVEQIASRLEGILPDRPQQLLSVTAAVYVDAERQRLAKIGVPVTVERLLPPVAEAPNDDRPIAR